MVSCIDASDGVGMVCVASVCVCVCERERERERTPEMKNMQVKYMEERSECMPQIINHLGQRGTSVEVIRIKMITLNLKLRI